MTKWEYLFAQELAGPPPTFKFLPEIKEPIEILTVQDTLDMLNKLGEDGWELADAFPGGEGENVNATLIFKRAVQ